MFKLIKKSLDKRNSSLEEKYFVDFYMVNGEKRRMPIRNIGDDVADQIVIFNKNQLENCIKFGFVTLYKWIKDGKVIEEKEEKEDKYYYIGEEISKIRWQEEKGNGNIIDDLKDWDDYVKSIVVHPSGLVEPQSISFKDEVINLKMFDRDEKTL